MFEALNSEVLLTGGILGACALALAGGVAMMKAPRVTSHPVDLDRAVKDAPYHRLHNVLPVTKS